jgi:6-phospho-beta-glucosidase
MFKQFPENFLWGAATSAPQTEGAQYTDGKSATVWDKWFELAPDRFYDGVGPKDTTKVYEHYKEDCRLMKDIGMNSIRTSISWARLLPDGKTLNPKAVDFYRNYFLEMRANDIEPIINLFHFDMPWWLMEKGGWEIRESVDAFAFYAKTAFECFGDIVTRWTTFNEPMVHIECGYVVGGHWPEKQDFLLAVQVGYHTLMAHVKAVQAFRQVNIPNGQIGIILNITPAYARSESPEDQAAKQAAEDLLCYSFLDPAAKGVVPSSLVDLLEKHDILPITEEGDLELMVTNTVDFIGLNYYQPLRVQAPSKESLGLSFDTFFEHYIWPERRMNEYRGWEIYPQAIYDVAIMMRDRYDNMPWYVSENGMGVAEEERFADADGIIQDDYRIDFMKDHLDLIHKAIQEGSACFGYHSWTFEDCWSWLNAYRNRYGFYRVELNDERTRTVKKSGLWFKDVVEHNGYER